MHQIIRKSTLFALAVVALIAPPRALAQDYASQTVSQSNGQGALNGLSGFLKNFGIDYNPNQQERAPVSKPEFVPDKLVDTRQAPDQPQYCTITQAKNNVTATIDGKKTTLVPADSIGNYKDPNTGRQYQLITSYDAYGTPKTYWGRSK